MSVSMEMHLSAMLESYANTDPHQTNLHLCVCVWQLCHFGSDAGVTRRLELTCAVYPERAHCVKTERLSLEVSGHLHLEK